MESTKNAYQRNGYKDRKHYLQCLSEDFNLPLDFIYAIAGMLGKNEDFDGLVSSLEDAEREFSE